jgi:hypothetical protein
MSFWVNVMVWAVSNNGEAKVIVFAPPSAFASLIAARKVQTPLDVLQIPSPGVLSLASPVSFTTKVAARAAGALQPIKIAQAAIRRTLPIRRAANRLAVMGVTLRREKTKEE